MEIPRTKNSCLNLILKKQIEEEEPFYSIIVFEEIRLAAATRKQIKIYNVETCKNELSIREEDDDRILKLSLLEKGHIASSLESGIIKLWEILHKNYKCLKVMKGHSRLVNKVIQLKSHKLCSCSDDKTIKIWDIDQDYKCIETKVKHFRWVKSVLECRNKGVFVSCGADKAILWSSTTFECIKEIFSVTCCGNVVETKEGKIAVGGVREISIINISTMQIESKIELNTEINYIFAIIEIEEKNTFLVGNSDSMILQISLKGEWRVVVEKAHEKCLNWFTMTQIKKDDEIISSFEGDKIIKFWQII